MFSQKVALELLKEEVESKKPYVARNDLVCAIGHENISEGDEFYFIGRSRVCNNCRAELADSL